MSISRRVAIVGGHGKVAQQLIGVLVDRGHTPVALVRSEDQRAELEAKGAEVGILDIEQDDVDAFARAFDGCDAVVFSAGGGGDGNAARKQTVDLGGSVKSAQAAAQAGIDRFVQVSAIGIDEPLADDTDDGWRAYVEAKRDADSALRDSALAWTIVRPGTLTDDPGTGLVTLGETVEKGEVPRADVAAVIALALEDDRTAGRQWELVAGDLPIADAVTAATAG